EKTVGNARSGRRPRQRRAAKARGVVRDGSCRILEPFVERPAREAEDLAKPRILGLATPEQIEPSGSRTVEQVAAVVDEDSSPAHVDRHAVDLLAVSARIRLLVVVAAAAVDRAGTGIVRRERNPNRT